MAVLIIGLHEQSGRTLSIWKGLLGIGLFLLRWLNFYVLGDISSLSKLNEHILANWVFHLTFIDLHMILCSDSCCISKTSWGFQMYVVTPIYLFTTSLSWHVMQLCRHPFFLGDVWLNLCLLQRLKVSNENNTRGRTHSLTHNISR